MIGASGTVTVSQTLGQGQKNKARGIFSCYTLVTIGFGLFAMVLSFLLMTPLCLPAEAVSIGIGRQFDKAAINDFNFLVYLRR
jgi:Na+-driven multidrug efflux pump